MNEQEARAFLETPSLAPALPTGTAVGASAPAAQSQFPVQQPTSLTPRTDAATAGLKPLTGLEIPKDPFGVEARYIKETQEPGVPLDVETGASPWERFWVGSMRDRQDALAYMQRKYGPKNVRLDKEGDFVFRVPDETTKGQKDIKFNPFSMSVGDAAALAGAIPEVAGSIIGIMGARKVPAMGKLGALTRDVLAGAAGAETAGALKDIPMHLAQRGQADIGETLKERGASAAEDVALGYATYGAGRFFKFLGAPFAGKRGPVQFNMEEARDYFKKNPRYGIDIPVSASEATGSPILGRAEVYTELQPGGYGPLRELKTEQEQKLIQLQNRMIGVAPPPSDVEIARRVEGALRLPIEAKEQAVETAGQTLKTGAEAQLEATAAASSTPARQLYRDVVGRNVRAGVLARQEAAMTEADRLYAEAERLGAKAKIIDGSTLQSKLAQILKDLPSATVEKETDIVGPTGRPLTRRLTETLEKWPPEKLLARLREITALEKPQFSISDLKQMRRDIYDDITRGAGVPGLGTHYLARIGKAITESIDDAVKKMPTSDLKDALQAADKHWKEKVVPFDRPGITELFRREGEGGFIPDDEVVSRIFSTAATPSVSIQNYNLLKETLGATSPEFMQVKRSLLDHIIESARRGGTDIDANALRQSLHDLRTKYRTIADDVLGPRFAQAFREADFLAAASNPKLSEAELNTLLRDPSPSAAKLRTLVLARQAQDDLYRNNIIRQASKNILNPGTINPHEFVASFIENPKTTEREIKDVLSHLAHSPSLLEDIQSKTLENILNRSGNRLTAGDISRSFAAQTSRVPSAVGLVKAIQQSGGPEKLKLLLGPEKFADLEQFFNLVRGTEYKYAASGYAMAGAFAATGTVKALEHLELIRFLKPTIANWVVAKILVNPVFRQWASHIPKNPDPGFISLFLSSPAFLKEVAKDFPGESGSMFITDLKNSVDQWLHVRETTKAPIGERRVGQPDEARMQEFREFLRQPSQTPLTKTSPNASTIRSNPGQPAQSRLRQQGSQTNRSGNIQQTAPGPSNASALPQEKAKAVVPIIRLIPKEPGAKPEVVVGQPLDQHDDIIKRHGLTAAQIDRRGFRINGVDEWNRQAAAVKARRLLPNVSTQVTPGELHASDVNRAAAQ